MDSITCKDPALFDLLSPVPIKLDGIGLIRKPKAMEIGEIQLSTYDMYINMLCMSVKSLIDIMQLSDFFNSLDDAQKSETTLFDLIVLLPDVAKLYTQILNFFIVGDVAFNDKERIFEVLTEKEFIQDDGNITVKKVPDGIINRDNYRSLFELILKINHIDVSIHDTKKIKSKKARKLMEQIEQAKQKKKQSKKDEAMNFGNIISKLCAYSQNTNMINVWDMTVYQIYNQFFERNAKNINDVRAMNYSYYGGDYDFTEWLKPIN